MPGTAFINWIEPQKKDLLSLWIYIFSSGGSLVGPFIGSVLINLFPSHKILFTWGSISILMLMILILFLFAFRNFDDQILIVESHYSKLEESGIEFGASDLMKMTPDKDLSPGHYRRKSDVKREKPKFDIDEKEMRKYSSTDHGINKNVIEQKRVRFETLPPDAEEQAKMQELEVQMRLLSSRKQIKTLSFWEIFYRVKNRRNLILLIGLNWGVKVIDWMLFSLWAETSLEKGGLGFSNVETGAISLLAFPMVSFVLLACFKVTKQGLQTNWMIYTTFSMFSIIILLPLLNLLKFSHEATLLMVIIMVSIKEGAFLIWMSTWSQIMTKLFPSMILGRVISWSYFIGHSLVLIYSQIYPRSLTFFIKDQKISQLFGRFRYVIFFFCLSIPLIISMFLTKGAKENLKEKDNIDI